MGKHIYTEIEKEQIAQIVYDWLIEHDAYSGEFVMQNDLCNLDSVSVMSDIADIKDVTIINNELGVIWDFIDSFGSNTDEWRFVTNLVYEYHKKGMNPDDYIDEIKMKVSDFIKNK